MIVATATDANYVELTGVLLASLAHHARGDIEKTYVFADRLSAHEKQQLQTSYGSDNLEIIDLTESDLLTLAGLPSHRRLSRTGYARLLMPAKLGDAHQRLLYIDCDCVINGPLTPLVDLSLEGHVLAAVADNLTSLKESQAARNRLIGLPEDTRYFNSGVLLIDLDRWRAEDVSERVRAFRMEHPELQTLDQDSLNGTLKGEWLELSDVWNMHRRLFHGQYRDPLEVWQGARILHFTGQAKPNYKDCTHPAQAIFLAHRARTPWADAPLKSFLGRKISLKLQKLHRSFSSLKRRLIVWQ
ncbi:MAG TPA: glycosyltransferase family 8 protein [Xanthobacteraceae bacterium]|nr:glycosyltransferase family 8 protein [Xanthobacteraceae bacterium]